MVQDVIEVLIPETELADGELLPRVLDAAGATAEVLLLRRGNTLKAWRNACPHAGRRLDYAPGKLLLQDGRLVCAAHGAQFELDGGRCVDGPGRGGGLAPLEVSPVPGAWIVRWRSA